MEENEGVGGGGGKREREKTLQQFQLWSVASVLKCEENYYLVLH